MKTILIILVFICINVFALAETINIPADQPTIQAGIDVAVDGDTVLIAENTYFENINFRGKAITVASHFILDQDTSHISKTIIDGSQPSNPDSGSVVYMIADEDTTSILMGFTVTGGSGTFHTVVPPNVPPFDARSGGGIYAASEKGASIIWNIIKNNHITTDVLALGGGITAGAPDNNSFLIIENNIIRNNSVSGEMTYVSGGAIFMGSNGRINNNTIINNLCHSANHGVAGGAIRFLNMESDYGPKYCLIENNIIKDNLAVSENNYSFGGGVTSSGIRMTLRNNQFLSNIARGHFEYAAGGGVYLGTLINGQHLIENNLFYGNEQDGGFYGGGLGVYGGSPIIRNNIFTANSAGFGGGFFQDNSASSRLISNTFYGNSAVSQGGGIYSRNSTLSVMNSIIWENTAPSGQQIYRTGGSVEIVYSDIQGGWAGEGNIDSDPMFTDTLFHLSDSSRCIGAGIESYNFSGTVLNAPGYDFAGNPRPNPAGSQPDMGAMENKRPVPLPIISIPFDYPTIQAGINAASNGDTVLVAEGTYYENVRIISKAVTLASHFLLDGDSSHISKTIINGSRPVNTDQASVITMQFSSEDTSVICGLTITGGYGNRVPVPPPDWTRVGAGIVASASNAIICNNRIINNIISSSTVPDAYVGGSGGGIIANPRGEPNLMVIVRDNLIAENQISSEMAAGGGILIAKSAAENFSYIIENNIIRNNRAINRTEWKAMGGGFYVEFYLPTDGTQIIRNNIISNNQAICDEAVSLKHHSFGGGMYIVLMESVPGGSEDPDPAPYIHNNIIAGNYSDYLGGGISVWRAYWPKGSDRAYALESAGHYTPKPSFINNTIVNNTAQDGSGFYIMNHKPFLMNNILWNDHPQSAVWGEIFLGDEPQWTEWVEPNTYGSAEIFYTDIQGGWEGGVGNRESVPQFQDAENGDFSLVDGSPGIGWGIESILLNDTIYASPASDYYGNPRPNSIDQNVDMGAVESPYVTDITDKANLLPAKFDLQQNYPNPFNPITTISYTLPVTCHLDLSVYNILGQKVATLVSEKQNAGSYRLQWDASNFASGVYLYWLETDQGFIQTKKLILIK